MRVINDLNMRTKNYHMYKINLKIAALFATLLLLWACEPKFEDYDFNAVYFPHQFPVRTISLGEDFFDNSNDRDHTFEIGVVIGGMYENTSEWTVYFEVDESLADSLLTSNGDTIRALPSSYYSLSNNEYITIPEGSFNGTIEVQLTDAFFEDTMATGVQYVVPLRITDTDADSILSGDPKASVPDPDIRFEGDWNSGATPKNFTLFGVKFINDMHGDFLYRGYDLKTFNGKTIDTTITRTDYLVDSEIWSLRTSALNAVQTNAVSFHISSDGLYKMELLLNNDNTISIKPLEGSLIEPYQTGANGTSTFVQDGAEWGGKPRDVMYLNYSYMEGGVLEHFVNDTLVFRDRAIKFEVFTPVRME